MSLTVNIEKTFPGFRLKADFSLSSGVLGVLGSSGCGKSMTLRCISGVEKPHQGQIILNNTSLYDSKKRINLPPQKRKVGHLFQNYALFPNMTLEQNLLCGIDKHIPNRQQRLEQLLEQFHLTELRKHRPAQLSGGQQQRGALARCLGAEPELLLLDEPFSALDATLKTTLQIQLKEHLAQFNGLTILVTHDRNEAYLLCDQIAIMEQGRILTIGEKSAVFHNPGSQAAAQLTGCKNIIPAVKAGEYQVNVPAWGCTLTVAEPVPEELTAIGVRAHDFLPASETGENTVSVTLRQLTEYPFERNAMFTTSGGGVLHWKVPKSHLEGEKPLAIPNQFFIPKEQILLLK
jgi:molybdate transport system ATP-binding protein